MHNDDLNTEWCLLQNQFDSYEKHSLGIKLTAIVLLSVAQFTAVLSLYFAWILAVLWLQDGIWKTFQSRIEARLLQLERAMIDGDAEKGLQFNSVFAERRQTGGSLISEYLRQSVRPTVAFPHVVLIALVLVQQLG